ncbi:protein-glutamate O-methyltransferase CheR [Labrenzia sp. CE80]|uniref:CheR family methyltransferase n=1 Tax=Labrenzia sp. CE80 TaxID=1788986 RepID=UPI00129A204E|nr:protein-glutamate O-methyltransferase CheR [Labrenzia sp. CE80]
MLAAAAQEADREFSFNEQEFRYLADLVKTKTGIVLADHKKNMVYSRLTRRLRALKLESFEAYCSFLESGDCEDEMGMFINAITTNLTRFFREPHHFDHLAEKMAEQFENAPTATRIRIWSAGCSSGEEPYSIAMTMAESLKRLSAYNFRILATDLDTSMVANATAGRYRLQDAEGISKAQLAKWTIQDRGRNEMTIKQGLRDLITFKQLNLLHDWPMKGQFDVIFCRNVMIYFDGPTKDRLLKRFHSCLAPGGWLYIGHSETILDQRDQLIPMGKTIYRKALR